MGERRVGMRERYDGGMPAGGRAGLQFGASTAPLVGSGADQYMVLQHYPGLTLKKKIERFGWTYAPGYGDYVKLATDHVVDSLKIARTGVVEDSSEVDCRKMRERTMKS